MTELLKAVAAAGPTLLVLEDPPLGGRSGVRLLAFLARRIGDWPLLIVVTVRQEDLAGAPLLQQVLAGPRSASGTSRRSRIGLAVPPGRGDARAHVDASGPMRAVLGSAQRPDLDGGEGEYPLVIVETIAGSATTQVRRPPPDCPCPSGPARQSLSGFGDYRTGPVRRRGGGGIIGREVDSRLLQRAADITAGVCAEAVEALVARGVLHVAGERLEFTHDRVREVAYAELLPPTRRVIHAMVGRTLEGTYAGRHPEVADQLARHFVHAEEPERAVQGR